MGGGEGIGHFLTHPILTGGWEGGGRNRRVERGVGTMMVFKKIPDELFSWIGMSYVGTFLR